MAKAPVSTDEGEKPVTNDAAPIGTVVVALVADAYAVASFKKKNA